ncbi:MAG: hypothetical protein J6T26_08630, partial [Firmicutes bacterium]|nr:hypothetical protein [Bacillota bacterium]
AMAPCKEYLITAAVKKQEQNWRRAFFAGAGDETGICPFPFRSPRTLRQAAASGTPKSLG